MSDDKITIDQFQEIINKHLIQEGVETETLDAPEPEDEMPEIDFSSASLSPENTLKHITMLVSRIQMALKRSPNNIIFLNMAMRLLDTQCKIQGMFNVKPETQGIIDSEVNTYKSKFIVLADNIISDKEELKNLMSKLAEEGL